MNESNPTANRRSEKLVFAVLRLFFSSRKQLWMNYELKMKSKPFNELTTDIDNIKWLAWSFEHELNMLSLAYRFADIGAVRFRAYYRIWLRDGCWMWNFRGLVTAFIQKQSSHFKYSHSFHSKNIYSWTVCHFRSGQVMQQNLK